jgi:hypothetical protein
MPQVKFHGTVAIFNHKSECSPRAPRLFVLERDTAQAQVPTSHYLQKPYNPASLASTIREILDYP